jgi:hypothetical protein
MDLCTKTYIEQQHPRVWALLGRSADPFCQRMKLTLDAGRDIAPNELAALQRLCDRRKLGRRY